MHTISRPHYAGLLRSTYKLQALRYTYKLQAPGRWAFVICMQIAGLSTLGFCDLLCRVSAPLLSAVAAWARSQSRRARATYLTLLGGRRDVCVLIPGLAVYGRGRCGDCWPGNVRGRSYENAERPPLPKGLHSQKGQPLCTRMLVSRRA